MLNASDISCVSLLCQLFSDIMFYSSQTMNYLISVLQHGHYYVKIERFLPRVDIVHKHSAAARRLYIRGHNGKVGI